MVDFNYDDYCRYVIKMFEVSNYEKNIYETSYPDEITNLINEYKKRFDDTILKTVINEYDPMTIKKISFKAGQLWNYLHSKTGKMANLYMYARLKNVQNILLKKIDWRYFNNFIHSSDISNDETIDEEIKYEANKWANEHPEMAEMIEKIMDNPELAEIMEEAVTNPEILDNEDVRELFD